MIPSLIFLHLSSLMARAPHPCLHSECPNILQRNMNENIQINFSVFGTNRRKDKKSQKENKKGIKNLILSRYLPPTPLQSSIDLTSPNSNKCNPHLSRSKRLKMYAKKKKKCFF